MFILLGPPLCLDTILMTWEEASHLNVSSTCTANVTLEVKLAP